MTQEIPAAALELLVTNSYARINDLPPESLPELRFALEQIMTQLSSGALRVATPAAQGWQVHEWLKKAILLYFRLQEMHIIPGAPDNTGWWDKVPMRAAGWTSDNWRAAAFRAVPGSLVRRGAYVAPGCVLMPSFVNVGAYVGQGTMVDTWATIGSCAQVGARCHISGGVGIGGVLEPVQAAPVIVEDDVFIGARSEVAEGVRVGQGAVISMGVFLGASTKIIDRASGQIYQGQVPPYSVVVPGSLPGRTMIDGSLGPSLYCAVIVKHVDAQTRSKTAINELLRD
jgi:2,3,4,5-tetrahydropyridine-2-carboxylate N-succinyltransferase